MSQLFEKLNWQSCSEQEVNNLKLHLLLTKCLNDSCQLSVISHLIIIFMFVTSFLLKIETSKNSHLFYD